MTTKKTKETKGSIVTLKKANEVPEFKRFYLQREEDVSGCSGTGCICVGVLFPSGACIIEWTSAIKSMGFYHSIADLEKLHGHDGRAKVIWIDE